MRKIKLTQGKYAIVDDDMCDFLNQWRWYYHQEGYAVRSSRMLPPIKKTIHMHHLIAGFPLNKKKVDHIDGNRLNNCRNNLRIVTHRENLQNSKLARRRKVFGCSYVKRSGMWRANIRIDGKVIYLGEFKDKFLAHRAYLERFNALKERNHDQGKSIRIEQ